MTTTEASRSVGNPPVGAATKRWHQWVAEHPVGGLVLVGVIATQLGTYFGHVFPAVGLPSLPWPQYNGLLALEDVGVFATYGTADAFWAGNALHFVNGIVFTILYGILARPMMPFRYDHNGHILSGLLYGTVMAIISVGLLVPYAYVPEQGYGFFLFDGPDGWKLPFAVLVWHLIYGFFIGLLYQPASEE